MKLFTFSKSCNRAFLLVAVLSTSLLAACSYKNGYTEPAPTTACNLPKTVSYQLDVLPILTQNCRNACHNPISLQGNFNMDDFLQVRYYAQPANGLNGVPYMVGNIRHDPGFPAMPQVGDKLNDCQIAVIKAWVDAGAPNN